jgi:pimeloyl-ACP methyl ester carboxylesterase
VDVGDAWPTVPPPPAPVVAGAPQRRRPAPLVVGVLLIGVLAAAGVWLLTLPDAHETIGWRQANAEAVRRAGLAPAYVEHGCPFVDGGDGVTCGTLLVPLDRSDPRSPTIEVAVARIAATGADPAPDPIVYLEGGPGGFAVADHLWWQEEMADLLEHRDVILVDQRGVGYSEPLLRCDELWDELWVEPTEHDPTAIDFWEAELTAVRACHDRLVAEGNDLAAYTTPAIAADIADLRAAMGLEEINLFGVSYGTRVALTVLRDHHEGIRSVVLDSVYPMEVQALDEQVLHAAAAIELVIERCEAVRSCAARHSDLGGTLDAAIAELNAAPSVVDVEDDPDQELSGDDLVDWIFGALYGPGALERVPDAIAAAADGDVPTALDLLDGSAAVRNRRTWADEESDGLFYSVTCREEAAVSDPAIAARRAGEVRPSLAAALLVGVERMFAVCEFWDAGRLDPSETEPVRSDVPALVLAGAYDPITPSAWSRQTADVLGVASYAEFPSRGHAVFVGSACATDMIIAFLAAPTDVPDQRCAATDR